MMKTKIIAIISMMLMISLPLTVTAQENIQVFERTQQINVLDQTMEAVGDILADPKTSVLLYQLESIIEPYVTPEIRAEAEVQGELLKNTLLTMEYDWGEHLQDTAEYLSELFIILFIISKLMFGQILGEFVGILCCGIAYVLLMPLGYLYASGAVLCILDENFSSEIDEYLTLGWWIYSCGILVGPILWIMFLTVALFIILPLSFIGGIPMFLISAWPLWNLAMEYTYDYFTG